MKKAQTWIITCFYLQLLLLNPLIRAQSPCGNPVTDDVYDIAKLVGNLPNDYMITLKYVRKMDSLNFRKYNDHLYEEGKFFPEEFFKHFNSTIDVYKSIAKAPEQSDCVLLSATEPSPNDAGNSVTEPILLHPVAASSLKNDSSGDSSEHAELGFLNSASMHGISIALTGLVTLLIGFILGALCWKKTTRKHFSESDQNTESNICHEDNEISMLQQKEKILLQV
ncbi:kit ligand isoform X3 [Lacerta agilis]|uniref:kit ligand isoform X3 n=1 Tax=Lacerta agilis TaxID=80427 RepID=UPI0014194720|nr:kit ligand isoform X3 [Lacerta agilis]